MSFSQMLNYFIDPAYQRGNCPEYRCTSDGRPVSFRIDDDLTPIPKNGVDEEVLKYMLGTSEKHLKIVLDEDRR